MPTDTLQKMKMLKTFSKTLDNLVPLQKMMLKQLQTWKRTAQQELSKKRCRWESTPEQMASVGGHLKKQRQQKRGTSWMDTNESFTVSKYLTVSDIYTYLSAPPPNTTWNGLHRRHILTSRQL